MLNNILVDIAIVETIDINCQYAKEASVFIFLNNSDVSLSRNIFLAITKILIMDYFKLAGQ